MKTLKVAVQKSGRLKDDSLKLLKDIGISVDNGKEQLKARATNFPIEVFICVMEIFLNILKMVLWILLLLVVIY